MASKDLHTLIRTVTSLSAAVIAFEGITLGASLDTASLQGVEFVMIAAVVTSGTWTLFLQDSDNDSIFTDVSQDFLIGTEAATATVSSDPFSITRTLGYVGHKRFVRPALRSVGGGSTADMTIIAIENHSIRPPINPNASTL